MEEQERGRERRTMAVDEESFNPSPADYSPSQSFARKRKSQLEGIFTGAVIRACFDGIPRPAYGENTVMMVGRLYESVFGIVLDTVEKVVVTGHVLQCNPVQASCSGEWTGAAIERMEDITKEHQGKIWNGYDDPRIGNSTRWVPEREAQKR